MGTTDTRYAQPTLANVRALAESMRADDEAECAALGFASPLEALTKCLASSDVSFVVLFGAEVAAIGGVSNRDEDAPPAAWVLTGAVVDKRPRDFLRWSKKILRQLLERYGLVTAHIDARYLAALRWARWLKAEVGMPQPMASGAMFHPITIRRGQWAHSQP